MTNDISAPYEDLLREVLEYGIEKKNERTGEVTKTLTGKQLRYDLREGFPLLTTKKVFFRGVAEELLWFLRGDTRETTLADKNVNIWNEWANEDGLLGPIYGSQWRKWYGYTDEVKEIEIPTDTHADYAPENEEQIQRLVAGVGYYPRDIEVEEASSRIYRLWAKMLWSCYDEEFFEYESYGAKGVTVSPLWHSYENFKNTIVQVPGFYHWLNNDTFVLDVRYFGAEVFSPDTTVFIPGDYSEKLTQLDGSAVKIHGKVYESIEQWDSVFARDASMQWSEGNEYLGVSPDAVEHLAPSEGHLYRRVIIHDQIAELVETLKRDPSSRRMVVSAWNPSDLTSMALTPCHMAFQVIVNDGVLDLVVTQRSADMFLGVPFNIASYALLAHMLAQQTGLKVGELVWNGGDVHVYRNHAEQATQQLEREAREYPTLKLRKAEDIFSYTIDDIEIEGYDPHPAIKAEVAI